MLLEAERTQIIAVDIQERLLPAMADVRPMVEHTELIAAAARRLSIPITASEQYPRGLGATFSRVRAAYGDDADVFEKVHFSCLRDDAIAQHIAEIRGKGRHQAVVIGIETHVCVAQTAFDLALAGYETYVVADAVSSRRALDKAIALDRFRARGMHVITSEMAVFEWLEKAGTDDFRAMAPLIK